MFQLLNDSSCDFSRKYHVHFSKTSILFSHLKRIEYLFYQQGHQFLTSPLFDTKAFTKHKKETMISAEASCC